MAEESPEDGPIVLPESVWQRCMYPDEKELEESRQWWSKDYGRELTLAETAEIHHNLFGLLKVLAEIDARQRATGQKADDNAGPESGDRRS